MHCTAIQSLDPVTSNAFTVSVRTFVIMSRPCTAQGGDHPTYRQEMSQSQDVQDKVIMTRINVITQTTQAAKEV